MRAFFLIAFSLATALPEALADDLTVVGTGDGIPVLSALGRSFTSENPDGRIILPPSIHSSGGIREVGVGDAVLGRIARPLKADEKELGIRVIPIFRQPVVFYAHRSARIKDLSSDQLVKIFTNAVTNWRDVGGADLRIRVVRREESDSTLAVLRDTQRGWSNLQFNVDQSRLALSTQESFDVVRSTTGAIGFGPFSYNLRSDFIVIRVNGVSATNPTYPSAVTLSLIYRDANVTKQAFRFIDFIFTPKGKNIIKENGGIPVARVPQSPAQGK